MDFNGRAVFINVPLAELGYHPQIVGLMSVNATSISLNSGTVRRSESKHLVKPMLPAPINAILNDMILPLFCLLIYSIPKNAILNPMIQLKLILNIRDMYIVFNRNYLIKRGSFLMERETKRYFATAMVFIFLGGCGTPAAGLMAIGKESPKHDNSYFWDNRAEAPPSCFQYIPFRQWHFGNEEGVFKAEAGDGFFYVSGE